LGQFVDTGPADDSSNWGYPWIVNLRPDWTGVLLGIFAHRTKLINPESLPRHPGSLSDAERN